MKKLQLTFMRELKDLSFENLGTLMLEPREVQAVAIALNSSGTGYIQIWENWLGCRKDKMQRHYASLVGTDFQMSPNQPAPAWKPAQ
jgi:hypothetical protein